MNSTEKLVLQNFKDRFTQVKGIKDHFKKISDKNLEIVKEIKASSEEDSSKFTRELTEFKKNEVTTTLLSQQLQSLVTRVVEYYVIIKGADLELELTDEDEKFLEGFLKEKTDLFGIEKGELIILNSQYHDVVMETVNNLKEGEAVQIFNYIKNFK